MLIITSRLSWNSVQFGLVFRKCGDPGGVTADFDDVHRRTNEMRLATAGAGYHLYCKVTVFDVSTILNKLFNGTCHLSKLSINDCQWCWKCLHVSRTRLALRSTAPPGH